MLVSYRTLARKSSRATIDARNAIDTHLRRSSGPQKSRQQARQARDPRATREQGYKAWVTGLSKKRKATMTATAVVGSAAEDTTPSEREAPQRFAWWHPRSADLGRHNGPGLARAARFTGDAALVDEERRGHRESAAGGGAAAAQRRSPGPRARDAPRRRRRVAALRVAEGRGGGLRPQAGRRLEAGLALFWSLATNWLHSLNNTSVLFVNARAVNSGSGLSSSCRSDDATFRLAGTRQMPDLA